MTKYHCQRINLVASAGTVTSLETTKKKHKKISLGVLLFGFLCFFVTSNLSSYILKPVPTASSTSPNVLLSIIIN